MRQEFISRQKGDILRDVSALGSLVLYVFIAVFFLAQENYFVFNRLLAGAVSIYAVTIAIRSFYFKERPNKQGYTSFIERLDASSFPSLHSSRISFLCAVFIEYFSSTATSAVLILVSLSVAYSRVYLKKHDWKDVSAGIVLGSAVYLMVQYLF